MALAISKPNKVSASLRIVCDNEFPCLIAFSKMKKRMFKIY